MPTLVDGYWVERSRASRRRSRSPTPAPATDRPGALFPLVATSEVTLGRDAAGFTGPLVSHAAFGLALAARFA